MNCRYREICPAYEKRDERCNKYLRHGSASCIPALLEVCCDRHNKMEVDFQEILKAHRYVEGTTEFKMLSIIDIFRSCEKEYQETIIETLKKVVEDER